MVLASFGIFDFRMTITLKDKVNALGIEDQGRYHEAYSRPTQQKKIIGLSLTVTEKQACEDLRGFYIVWIGTSYMH